jgi:hypothetical protein
MNFCYNRGHGGDETACRRILRTYGRSPRREKDGFAAGLRVRWLPKADGRRRTEFARDRMKDDWAWYDLGEWDFSSFVICLNLHSKEFMIVPARMICAWPSWARQEAKDSTGDVKP